MTTFTTEDRENAFGVTINVEPIPFAGMVTITETMPTYKDQADLIAVLKANNKIQLEINAKQFEYIAELEKALESSLALNKAQANRK
jgi:hypothetical protein